MVFCMMGLKRRRQRRLFQRPFPPEWLDIVERNMPYFHLLSQANQEELTELYEQLKGFDQQDPALQVRSPSG